MCQKCYVLNDQELCEICNSANRNNNSICVVESTSDLYSIEETSEFDGRYFVLNGLLSPIDNIGAEELRIEKLLDLIEEFNSKEVILALNSTLEGEASPSNVEFNARMTSFELNSSMRSNNFSILSSSAPILSIGERRPLRTKYLPSNSDVSSIE